MRGKQKVHRLNWCVFGWALAIAIALFIVGTLAYKQLTRPTHAEIQWEYPMSTWQVIARGEPHPNGGVVLCGKDRLDFIDRKGKAYSVIQAPQYHDFKYSRFDINHFDSQGNYYTCIEDKVCSYDTIGRNRWEVYLDQQTTSDCRFGRIARCRVSDNDQILVVYNSDEFAILDTEGEVQLFVSLPFVTIVNVVPMEVKGGDYLLGINRDETSSTLGLALIDRNGEVHRQIRTLTKLCNNANLYDSTIIISDRDSMTYAFDLDGDLKWQCSSPVKSSGSRQLQAMRLSETSDMVLCIDSDHCAQLTCFTLDGDRQWSVKLPGVQAMVSKSEEIQYVITHQEPTNTALIKTLGKINPNLAYNCSSYVSSYLLVELTNGKISKRWELPFEPTTISIGQEGELYITSANEMKLYCVIPE